MSLRSFTAVNLSSRHEHKLRAGMLLLMIYKSRRNLPVEAAAHALVLPFLLSFMVG